MQVLNGYLESAKRHIEEEISAAGVVTNAAETYLAQQTSLEQPEAQKQLSEVKDRVKELAQQNSQVEPASCKPNAACSCTVIAPKQSGKHSFQQKATSGTAAEHSSMK